MKTALRFALAMALAVITGLTTIGVAEAAPAPPYDPAALVKKAFAGTISADEKVALIKNDPALAAVVPDFSLSSAGSRSTAVPNLAKAGGVTTAATTRCSTYTGWNTFKSVLGFTIYKFTHDATVCSNGTVVTSHSSPTYEMSSVDPTVSDWTVVDKYVKNVNTAQSKSRIQVKVTQCVLKYGCYAYTYPTGTILGNKNNTATISTTIG